MASRGRQDRLQNPTARLQGTEWPCSAISRSINIKICTTTATPFVGSISHYNDVIMGAIASQITSLTSVYLTIYSGADQRKHQSSASLAFVRGIHRGPVNFAHKCPVSRKMIPFDDVIMWSIHQDGGMKHVEPSTPQHEASSIYGIFQYMMTSSNGNIFRSSVNSPHKGQ